jgi:hypothetical protein
MTSARKAESNRRNALKSTGPKTPEGKAAMRLNALKHGLLSREIFLPGEDEAALEELRRLMCNCEKQRRSRNLMLLVPNLRPKVVSQLGSRLLLDLIVRARG